MPWAHLYLESLGLASLLRLSQYCICLDLKGCIIKMFSGFSTESVGNTTRNNEKNAVTKHQGCWNWGNWLFLRVTGQVNYEQGFCSCCSLKASSVSQLFWTNCNIKACLQQSWKIPTFPSHLQVHQHWEQETLGADTRSSCHCIDSASICSASNTQLWWIMQESIT